MTEPPGEFAEKGYVLLRNLLPESLRSFLYEYAIKSAQNGLLQLGDTGVPGTPCCYGDSFMESLLEMLQPRIEAEKGCFNDWKYDKRQGLSLTPSAKRIAEQLGASLVVPIKR